MAGFVLGFFVVFVAFFFNFVSLQEGLRHFSMTHSSRSGLWFFFFLIRCFYLFLAAVEPTPPIMYEFLFPGLLFCFSSFIWRLLNKRIKPKVGAFNCEIIGTREPNCKMLVSVSVFTLSLTHGR